MFQLTVLSLRKGDYKFDNRFVIVSIVGSSFLVETTLTDLVVQEGVVVVVRLRVDS